MTSIYLTKTDPDRNMARFYAMTLQPTLFGECSVIREWGRIGRGGRVVQTPFPSQKEAEKALQTIAQTKLKRGYSPRTGSCQPLN